MYPFFCSSEEKEESWLARRNFVVLPGGKELEQDCSKKTYTSPFSVTSTVYVDCCVCTALNPNVYSLQLYANALLGIQLEELASKARLEVVELFLGEVTFWLESVDPWAADLEVLVRAGVAIYRQHRWNYGSKQLYAY